jgi:hypothetical protein
MLPRNVCLTQERECMQNFGYKISWNDEKDGSIKLGCVLVRQVIRNELRMRIPEVCRYFKTTLIYRCKNGGYSAC